MPLYNPTSSATSTSAVESDTLYVYGHSYTVSPGVKCTSGREFFNKLKTRLSMASATTYGVSGTWSNQTAIYALGSGSPNWTAGGIQQAGVTGCTWPGSSRTGVVVVDTAVNDYANILNRQASPVVAVAMTAQSLNGKTEALRTLLALITSASRTEFVVGDVTGTWTTNNIGVASGGTNFYSSTAGDSASKSVTVPAAGYVWVLLQASDPASLTAAPCTIAVDGVTAVTVTGSQLQMKQYAETTGSTFNYTPYVAKVTATPGTHTITVTHAGTNGQFQFVDAILSPSSTPPIVLVCEGPTLPGAGTVWTSGDVTLINANKPQVDTAFKAVVATFPTAVWVPTTITSAGLSTADVLHPNDRGMTQRANDVQRLLGSFLQANDPDTLYPALA